MNKVRPTDPLAALPYGVVHVGFRLIADLGFDRKMLQSRTFPSMPGQGPEPTLPISG